MSAAGRGGVMGINSGVQRWEGVFSAARGQYGLNDVQGWRLGAGGGEARGRCGGLCVCVGGGHGGWGQPRHQYKSARQLL